MTIQSLDNIAHAIHAEMEKDAHAWSAVLEIHMSLSALDAIDRELHEYTAPGTPFNHTMQVDVRIGDVAFKLREKTTTNQQNGNEQESARTT